jgi:hypothetical protein
MDAQSRLKSIPSCVMTSAIAVSFSAELLPSERGVRPNMMHPASARPVKTLASTNVTLETEGRNIEPDQSTVLEN